MKILYYLINRRNKVAIEMLLDKTKHSPTECELILRRICIMLGSDWTHIPGSGTIDGKTVEEHNHNYTIIPAS